MAAVNLTADELALISASLRYWRDEMAQAGHANQQYYFDRAPIPSFDAKQIESLIDRLQSSNESSTRKENP
ncbi:hypothetical protein [Roseiconus lacunae]|uniref:Uncharacterized protein n=1 Tax=Roseiconus lacunae TaxID=2605694 RepID=A0ABT7PF60_9BACT|nr:hypothetical protein [Roseiconus lacunae]MDM4015132.1 hypothetical protein [Roseiconus lacunae]